MRIKLITLLLVMTVSVMAQSPYYTVDKNEFYKFYSLGRFHLDQGNFQEAFNAFSKMDSMYPGNSNVQYYLGLCKYNQPYHKKDAIPYFSKILSHVSMNFKGEYMDTTAPVFTFFYLADACLADEQVDTAIVFNRMYYSNIEKYYAPAYYSDMSKEEILGEADRQLALCYAAKKYMANPMRIKVSDIGNAINTQHDDYYLVLSPDGKTMIFTSKIPYKNRLVENIFISKEVNGKWTTPVNMYPSGDNMVGVSLSANGKQLVLFKRDVNNGDIYTADIQDTKLTNVSPIKGKVNTKELETFASLSPDGNTLYFASERKGGCGGMDLWYSKKDATGAWGEGVNMGFTINTDQDELSPFMSFDGKTLYFSSNGHESMGGFDIFKTSFGELGIWLEPQNVGYPLNTPDDNFYMAFANDNLYVYFSKLNSSVNVDLYKALILENVKQVLVKGSVVDAVKQLPLSSTVHCISTTTHDTLSLLIAKEGSYKLYLPVNQSFDLVASADSFSSSKQTIQVIQDDEILVPTIVLSVKPLEQVVSADITTRSAAIVEKQPQSHTIDKSTEEKEERIELRHVYFDFNKATLQESSFNEIEKLVSFLNKNRSVKILLVGYTDSIGSAAFNKELSTQRAKAIYKELVKRGISDKRLSYIGAGFEKPVADNTTEAGRQLNRRVEFVIKKK